MNQSLPKGGKLLLNAQQKSDQKEKQKKSRYNTCYYLYDWHFGWNSYNSEHVANKLCDYGF